MVFKLDFFDSIVLSFVHAFVFHHLPLGLGPQLKKTASIAPFIFPLRWYFVYKPPLG